MRPTEILSAEHRVIEQILDCLENIAAEAQRRGVLDIESAQRALRILKTFADTCHHGKEEHHLFPKLQQLGIPRGVGPLAVMLEEHDVGRAHIRGMDESMRALAGGDRAALERFATHATGYVQLLREHIQKEDSILFPMAEAALKESDRRELVEAFGRVENEELDPGTHAAMLALADGLAEKYGVVKASARTPAPFHGCCHRSTAGAR